MQSEFFDCSICINRYNSVDRLPKILPACGHTICSSCLKQILQSQHVSCPLDRKPLDKSLRTVDMIPTNILILQMLDGKSSTQYNKCAIHKEPLSLYCLVEKREICEKCAKDKNHKDHNVQSISDILSKAATKKNRLKGILNDFEGEVHTVHTLLEENKKNTFAIMKDKFMKLRDLINKKEQEISSEIDLFFTKEKLRVDSQIQNDLSTRELIRNKINNLSQLEINEKLLKELDDDSHLYFSSANQYNAVYSHSKEIQQNIENAFNNLISLAGSVIQEFRPLPENLRQHAQEVFNAAIPRELQLGMYKNLRIEVEFGWLIIYPLRPEDNHLQVERNNSLSLSMSKDITKVCLDFRKQRLSKELIVAIAMLWKGLQNITFVKLLLTNKDFNNQDLTDLCAYNFWCDKQVQALYLYLITTKVNESGIKKLAQVIDGQNIKTFAFDCSYSTFTDSCMKEISSILIGKLQLIESLDFRASNTTVTDASLEDFFKELSKVMSHMKILDLWLDFTGIKEKGFDYFAKNLLPLGKNMTNLSIHCPKYEGSSANFIRRIIEAAEKNLVKLKQLGLFYEKRGLTEETKAYIEEFKSKTSGKITTNF